jgi:predicted outer membrane repeat protein
MFALLNCACIYTHTFDVIYVFIGAALYASYATVILISCLFNSNTATGAGAGVFTYSTTLMITSSTFKNNSAVLTGGAISAEHGWISCTSSIFTTNNAANGGAVSLVKVARDNNANNIMPSFTGGSFTG